MKTLREMQETKKLMKEFRDDVCYSEREEKAVMAVLVMGFNKLRKSRKVYISTFLPF